MAGATAPAAAGVPGDRDVWRTPPTHVVLLAGLVGALLGVAVVTVGHEQWPDASRRAMSSGPFVLWVFLVSVQTMLWTLAIVPAGRVAWSHRRLLPSAWPEVALSSLIFAGVFGAIAVLAGRIVPQPDYVPHATTRMSIVLVVGGSVGLVAGWGLWLTRHAALELQDSAVEPALRLFASARRDVERLLGILAAVIAVAVLATAAQRRVVISFMENLTNEERAEQAGFVPFEYPGELVLVYGLVFTIVLALAALPTLATLETVGRTLGRRATDSAEERRKLSAEYGLQVAPAQVLRATLAILAPLLGSLAGLLPGTA